MEYIMFPLLIITFFLLTRSEKACKTHLDCSEHKADMLCSLCVVNDEEKSQKVSTKKFKCFYPFPEVFKSSETNKKCEFTTKCEHNPCAYGGTCKVNKGVGYVCSCVDNYYGKYCELEHSNTLPTLAIIPGFSFDIIGKLKTSEIVKNKMSFSNYKCSSPRLPILVVNTNEGYFSLFKKVNELYLATIVYPYKKYHKSDGVLTYMGYLGYFTDIRVTAYVKESAIFQNVYKVLVSYRGVTIDCVPEVRVDNCGPLFDSATSYEKKSSITLNIQKSVSPQGNGEEKFDNPQPVCDNKKVKINLNWNVYNVDINKSTAKKDSDVLTNVKSGKESTIYFHSYKLGFGIYWVNVEARIVREKGTSVNNGYCFFQVTSLPLKPVIKYGSIRRLSTKDKGLVMNAMRSKDPNVEFPINHPITAKWTCSSNLPKSAIGDICEPKILKSTEPYVIPPGKIPDQVEFNFTLEIWSNTYKDCTSKYCYEAKEHRFANQLVVFDTAQIKSFLLIECHQNCEPTMFTFRVFVLKVSIFDTEDFSDHHVFNWTYGKTGDTNIISWPLPAGLPSYIFELETDILNPGFQYTVNVTTMVEGVKLTSSYSFETDTLRYNGTCEIRPQNGTVGHTYFDIFCNTSLELSFTFEFYDVSTKNTEFEGNGTVGRMLGFSTDGNLQNIRLTRGTVVIYITYDDFFTKKELLVQLEEPELPIDLKDDIKQLKSYIETGPLSRSFLYTSFIADMLTNNSIANSTIHLLLSGVLHSRPQNAHEVRIHQITLYIILSKLNSLGFCFPDINFMTINREIIFLQSKYIIEFKGRYFYHQIKAITRYMINNIYLSSRLEREIPLKFPLSKVNIKSLYDLSQCVVMLEETLENIKDVITFIQMPGLKPTKITSINDSLTVWALKDDPEYHYTLSEMIETLPVSPVRISEDLLESIQYSYQWEGNLQFCIILINDSFIRLFDSDLSSNSLYLSLDKTQIDFETLTVKPTNIKDLEITIDINLILESLPIKQNYSGIVTQFDPTVDEEKVDLLMKIIRLDPAPNSSIVITFFYPPSNGSFRVLIQKDYRPTYQMTVSNHKIVNEQTPFYSLLCQYSEEETKPFYYMAILPGTEVPVNHSVGYSFTTNNTACQSWSGMKWSSEGCRVGEETAGYRVHCQCTHLSIFEAISPFLPNKVDPFTDSSLFLTVLDNPLVVCLMLTIFIFYLILLILACVKDKKDRYRGVITVLEDNLPGDSEAYLLAVCTSAHFFAGTNANVGIKLEGDQGFSRAHILTNQYRRGFSRDTDCWFLFFAPKSLGFLQKLHIWHDSSGFSPSWYCDKIHVYDLKGMMETIFIADQWLELSEENYPEALLLPASPSEILSPRRLFFSNLAAGLKSKETLGGVFMKHPRGIVSRVQMLNMAMSAVMVALLCSIMFYNDPDEGIDEFSYNVRSKEVIVSFITIVFAGAFSTIIEWQFNKSYKIVYKKNLSSLCLRANKFEQYYYNQLQRSSARHPNESLKEYVFHSLKNNIKPKSLVPAHLSCTKPIIKTFRVWLTITWLTCALIIILCMYFTILYGLKLGLIKSKKWLTSVFMSYVEDSFCVSPLMLISTVIIVTVAFDVVMSKTSFQIDHSDILNSRPKARNEDYLNNLCMKRDHPMYKPLSDRRRAQILAEHERIKHWINILQFLVSLGFVIIVLHLCHTLWGLQYYVNSHLTAVITSHWFKNIGFLQARNISEVNSYIETTFLQDLYNSRWYNNDLLSSNERLETQYWTSDFTWKMVGVPSLRQLRVKPKTCIDMVLPNNSCIPPWSPGTEDTDVYNVGWRPFTWRDADVDDSPWRYTSPTSSWLNTMYRLCGLSGTIYDNGGFIARLHPLAKDTLGKVSDLIQNSWQDHFTRVVFMELTLCHTNSPVLSKITLITEYLVSSVTLKAIHVYSTVECTPWTAWTIMFIVMVFMLFLEFCFKINQNGFLSTLKKINNIVLLAIIIMGFLLIIIRCVHYIQCLMFNFNQRHGHNSESYFDFDSYVTYELTVGRLLGYLLLTSICRTVVLLKVGKMLTVYYDILAVTLRTIVWLELILFTYFMFTQEIFIRTNLLIWDGFIFVITHNRRIVPSKVENISYIMIFFLIMKFLLSSVIVTLFLTVFICCKKTIRSKDTSDFNFLNFLTNELKRKKCKKHNEK